MHITKELRRLAVLLAVLFTSTITFASGESHEGGDEEKFNPTEMIMHHIADAHEWHLWDVKGDDGELHGVSIPLPIILYTDQGISFFMSSEFHHSDDASHVAEVGGQRFVKYHEKIYYASEIPNEHGQFIEMDADHHASNAMPLDFSITKNVFAMFVSVILLLLIFGKVGASYKKNKGAPKGLTSFIEPLVVFVRDEIAIPNIGEKKYMKFMPFLLTAFFFIWINNLLGLIPIFPGGANFTGNIAVTMVLAAFTLIITNVNGNKHYWQHIFWMPGVPVPVKIFLIPIELIGALAKPFALMIRLFANISAGHIIILSLISLIFIFKSVAISPVSIAFSLFMNVMELLVAALQAFIFTLLSALFIGAAVDDHH